MRGKNYITINGNLYDAVTGLPVDAVKTASAPAARGKVMSDVGFVPAKKREAHRASLAKKELIVVKQPVARTQPHNAHADHQTPQASKTLRRTGLKKPVLSAPKPISTQSPHISKFGRSTAAAHVHVPAKTTPRVVKPLEKAVAPQVQIAAKPVHAVQHSSAALVKPKPHHNKQLKEALIKQSLRHVDTISALDKKKGLRAKLYDKHPRFGSALAGVAALVILGGYLTYINMPGLSMKIAATRANVAATYPSYNPSGYSFNGPVAFSNGEVKVNFKSNTNSYAYTVTEKNSPWDSQALLDNYVTTKTDDYLTLQESGLTIYIHENQASWVNGGVFYSVDYKDAPLSSDQIQKIASSTL